ncbi:MAG: Uma2 family endonuclease [Desulfobacterales bacterium]|nr:Uma2 family endonuclease [Desulfobacterales bacterium]MBF0397019.1 Uma2 family endonuclease [Desulfobacterales bacterium]
MLTPIKTNANYEDLYTIPENMIGEIIDGELYAMPRPSYRHSNAASIIGWQIIGPYRFGIGGPGGWIILDEPEIKFSESKSDTVVPDLAGWKKERMPELPKKNWTSIAPDWICEVLSPKTNKHDRKKKMPIYAKFGVSFLWLVNPIEKTLEIFKLASGKWSLLDFFSDDDKACAEPFHDIEIELKNFWA